MNNKPRQLTKELTISDLNKILRLRDQGLSLRDIAKLYSTSPQSIKKIVDKFQK